MLEILLGYSIIKEISILFCIGKYWKVPIPMYETQLILNCDFIQSCTHHSNIYYLLISVL